MNAERRVELTGDPQIARIIKERDHLLASFRKSTDRICNVLDPQIARLVERIAIRDKAIRSAIKDIETAICHPDGYEGSQFLKAARDDLSFALGDIPAGENVLVERVKELEEACKSCLGIAEARGGASMANVMWTLKAVLEKEEA